MTTTYELIPADPSRHPVTGDLKIRQAVELINARRFSASELDRHLKHIQELYDERPPEVVAPLAHHVLKAALQLDAVRADGVERILAVIKERGLWVEPADSAGGRAPGIEPAETFEEFVERNKLTAAALAERERQAAEAGVLTPNGTNQHTQRIGLDNYQTHSGGTDSSYLLAKLARDRPDFLDRWKAGEFRSVRAACLAAGIIKPQAQLVLTKDPFGSAQRICEQRSHDWIDDLIRALSPGGVSVDDRPGEVRAYLESLPPDRLRHVLSSLCRIRPDVFEQLMDDMADEDPELVIVSPAPPAVTPAPAPGPSTVRSPAPASSSNGHAKPKALNDLPAPGFYSASTIVKATGASRSGVLSAATSAEDGGEILKRTMADTPIKVIVHKKNEPAKRYEVLPR